MHGEEERNRGEQHPEHDCDAAEHLNAKLLAAAAVENADVEVAAPAAARAHMSLAPSAAILSALRQQRVDRGHDEMFGITLRRISSELLQERRNRISKKEEHSRKDGVLHGDALGRVRELDEAAVGEEADGDGSPEAGRQVHRDGVDDVIEAQAQHEERRELEDKARADADEHRGPRLHERAACARRAGSGSSHGRTAAACAAAMSASRSATQHDSACRGRGSARRTNARRRTQAAMGQVIRRAVAMALPHRRTLRRSPRPCRQGSASLARRPAG